MSKKVQFGIKDITLWALTEEVTTTGVTMTYGDAIPLSGTTKIDLSPNGSDPTPFYADDVQYYVTAGKSSGFTGSFDNALITEAIKTTFLNYVTDSNGNIVELADSETKYFAMAFAKESNDGDIRFLLPKCSFGRLGIKGDTTTDTVTPETENLGITAVPTTKKFTISGEEYQICSVVTGENTTTASFNAWFTTPQLPNVVNGEG